MASIGREGDSCPSNESEQNGAVVDAQPIELRPIGARLCRACFRYERYTSQDQITLSRIPEHGDDTGCGFGTARFGQYHHQPNGYNVPARR